eukprot:gene3453-13511_t
MAARPYAPKARPSTSLSSQFSLDDINALLFGNSPSVSQAWSNPRPDGSHAESLQFNQVTSGSQPGTSGSLADLLKQDVEWLSGFNTGAIQSSPMPSPNACEFQRGLKRISDMTDMMPAPQLFVGSGGSTPFATPLASSFYHPATGPSPSRQRLTSARQTTNPSSGRSQAEFAISPGSSRLGLNFAPWTSQQTYLAPPSSGRSEGEFALPSEPPRKKRCQQRITIQPFSLIKPSGLLDQLNEQISDMAKSRSAVSNRD